MTIPITLSKLIELRRSVPIATYDSNVSLADRFLLPPFSVLDARQGYWQKRKKMWLDLGIQSELGRGGGVNNQSEMALRLAGGFDNHPAHKSKLSKSEELGPIPGGKTGKNSAYLFHKDGRYQSLKGQNKRRLAKTYNMGMKATKDNNWSTEDNQGSGTSIFDPVLCEIAYRWFCPLAGRVLDPFAGGSVRGIVAAKLRRSYSGVDLRSEQAEANYDQAEVICYDCETDLRWVVGDSINIATLLPGEYDLVFSCPPYADLERYSDDPRDLSTMEYTQFLSVYRTIIGASCSMLRENRFACFVVGDIRDRATGFYRNLVGDTIRAFRDAGLELYNDAVLVTSVGSLPIRVGKQFANYRKLGKTHQNVLVFLKGDAGRATEACGPVDINDLEMPEYVEGAVAMCRQEVMGTLAEGRLMGTEPEVGQLNTSPTESYLLCDIVRGWARASGTTIPRCWVGIEGQWLQIESNVDLTYLVGDEVYLNTIVFPEALSPQSTPPPPRRMRGGL